MKTVGEVAVERVCLLASDVRMFRNRLGEVRATHPSGCYEQWATYASIFDQVQIAARFAENAEPDFGPAAGPKVIIHELPNYNGLWGLVRAIHALIKSIRSIPIRETLPILRLPEPLSVLLAIRAVANRTPYVAQVVADVESCWITATGTSAGWRAIGWALRLVIRWLIRQSNGVIYVTEETLQRRYPPPPDTPIMTRSNVRIDMSNSERIDRSAPLGRRLIAVGSQQSLAKGHDVAIRALRLLCALDRRYELVLVGDGKMQRHLRNLAMEEGVRERVIFRGRLSHADVLGELGRADLFLMPSRTEGLPRALIEAMVMGLPAVASRVGGIPELLDDSSLVHPDDPGALAEAIHQRFMNVTMWPAESEINQRRARLIIDRTKDEYLAEFLLQLVPASGVA